MNGDLLARGWRMGPAQVGNACTRVYRRLSRWDAKGRLTAAALALIIGIALFGALWGAFVADPDIKVQELDAGPVTAFEIGKISPYPELNVYLVGMQDGRIRALDGIVKDSGCAVEWRPDDTRAASANPNRTPGAYVDPCSGAVWNKVGDAFTGTRDPLRTFRVSYDTNEQGVQHVYVEVIGDRDGQG